MNACRLAQFMNVLSYSMFGFLCMLRWAKKPCYYVTNMQHKLLSHDVASESVIGHASKPIIHQWIKYANYVIMLCVDVHENAVFSKAEIATI